MISVDADHVSQPYMRTLAPLVGGGWRRHWQPHRDEQVASWPAALFFDSPLLDRANYANTKERVMARSIATNTVVSRDDLLEFVRPRHRMILVTRRRDGTPQLSPVTGGVDDEGRIVISTYPGRAKTRNAEQRADVSVCVISDNWNDAWVQIDGTAEVLHQPESIEALVDYFRCISGEHPNWDEYRAAMRTQGKSLIRITPTRWGPVATGGFPADVAQRLENA